MFHITITFDSHLVFTCRSRKNARDEAETQEDQAREASVERARGASDDDVDESENEAPLAQLADFVVLFRLLIRVYSTCLTVSLLVFFVLL